MDDSARRRYNYTVRLLSSGLHNNASLTCQQFLPSIITSVHHTFLRLHRIIFSPFDLITQDITTATMSLNEPPSTNSLRNVAIPSGQTVVPLQELSPQDQMHVYHLNRTVAAAWGLLSITSAFPAAYMPHPDPMHWDILLLESLLTLAQMTSASSDHRHAAIKFICLSRELDNICKWMSMEETGQS